MKKVAVISPAEAGALIPDGATVTVSSSSGLGCPDAVLRGVGERFSATGSPSNVTTIHPIAAGDMSGIKGIDHLVKPGLLTRVIAGSYPSGPSKSEPPLIWQAIENDDVEAYNLPSGVLFQMHRAAAAGQPGVFTHVGLDTFVDPRHTGGRMNARTKDELVRVREIDGTEWLHYPALVPDVAIIRATTADEWGNLTYEDEASALGALDQAYAAHNHGGTVIAQVRRLAAGGSLHPQHVRVPGILVDAVVVVPDQLQTTGTPHDPTLSGELRTPLGTLAPEPFSLEKVIARRAAHEIQPGDIVNLGFGISALVPRILVEEGVEDEVSWVLEQGAVGGVPLTGFAFGCAINAQALMPSIDQFTLLQGAGFDRTMLSFLEIDEEGSVNVHALPHRRHVTAGVGGFADITSRARSLVFSGNFTAGRRDIGIEAGRLVIRTDGKLPKLVKRVAEVTFSGRRALAQGQRVIYVTERCVLELRAEGLTVTELAPGADLQRDVLDRAEFTLRVADDLKEMDARVFDPERMDLKLGVPLASAA
ncbi:hypothetical protein OJ998_04810 [Solirubrobacter taibaiensis]|nr:hypothetical protein [Solirubrobacter taibaiensis]